MIVFCVRGRLPWGSDAAAGGRSGRAEKIFSEGGLQNRLDII